MHNRGAFWTPVIDWGNAQLDRKDVHLSVVAGLRQILLVSGDTGAFLSRRGLRGGLGPRDEATGATYALSLAPDRVLFASETSAPVDLGWTETGFAVADMTDGIIAIDVLGAGALSLMQQGTSYDLAERDRYVGESANLVFAGLRVAVVRRADGYRLHVERPFATTLWTWLEQASAQEG